jgi:hypothetical protein
MRCPTRPHMKRHEPSGLRGSLRLTIAAGRLNRWQCVCPVPIVCSLHQKMACLPRAASHRSSCPQSTMAFIRSLRQGVDTRRGPGGVKHTSIAHIYRSIHAASQPASHPDASSNPSILRTVTQNEAAYPATALQISKIDPKIHRSMASQPCPAWA